MNKEQILKNQIDTDLKIFEEDIKAGVYKNDLDGFIKEAERIYNKLYKNDKPINRCPKCGNEVLGDEEGLCQYCI